jgi:hypothetical protein
MLDKGERVLSPAQNVELMEFLDKANTENGGSVTIEGLHVHILENATNLDAMRTLTKGDWQDLVMDKIVPALSTLKRRGISA